MKRSELVELVITAGIVLALIIIDNVYRLGAYAPFFFGL